MKEEGYYLKVIKILLQIILIYGYLLVGEASVALFNLPLPGSIVGLALLFISLYFKWIKLAWVDAGAKFLTAELLLFFIPSAVGIVNYQSIISLVGVKLILVIFASTILVMAATGLVADFFGRKKVGADN